MRSRRLIPVIVTFFTGVIAFSFTRLGKAVAKRIEGGQSDEVLERITRLEEDNDALHRALLDTQQRLNDAERRLVREPRDLLPGR